MPHSGTSRAVRFPTRHSFVCRMIYPRGSAGPAGAKETRPIPIPALLYATPMGDRPPVKFAVVDSCKLLRRMNIDVAVSQMMYHHFGTLESWEGEEGGITLDFVN